ncbi:MAG: SAM-dependent methyltransferase [Rhodobacteraceae bacterium]|nr:SAM-dependent methyltransferase [Paracoccaceae bacterium]
MTPLAALIRARITEAGPIPLAEYMSWCLGHPEHGYYMTRDPLGAAGDFTTAPEISQMFGELLGAWLARVWLDQGRPSRFVLAELGPGRGTLLCDALRAAGRMPGFREAAALWLVETSPVLRGVQAETLAEAAPAWASRVEELPEGPLFVLANEFFDALPIRQFQRTDPLWRERRVGLAPDGEGFAFTWARPEAGPELDQAFGPVPDGAIVETNPVGASIAGWLGARIAAEGGATLVIDYGAWDGTGDTLQALRAHEPVDPLGDPGCADLTAHVRFRALAEAAGPARAHGTVAQGVFLERLGITARAQSLARGKSGAAFQSIAAAHRRLTHPAEMGNLFQVLALLPETAAQPPGFET